MRGVYVEVPKIIFFLLFGSNFTYTPRVWRYGHNHRMWTSAEKIPKQFLYNFIMVLHFVKFALVQLLSSSNGSYFLGRVIRSYLTRSIYPKKVVNKPRR